MVGNESDAKTYRDLMQLLPDVAKIKLWWTLDEDGFPQSIRRLALHGHDGVLLVEIDAEEVEEMPSIMLEALNPTADKLLERLPAALTILSWLDAPALEPDENASILVLPSASHVGNEPPREWFEQ